MHDNELALVRRAAGGDRQALDGLLSDEFIEKLYRYAAPRVKSRADAEDVVIEALAKVTSKLGSFCGRSAFRTWVQGFVDNEIREYRRRRQLPYVCVSDDLLDERPALGNLYRDPMIIALEGEAVQAIQAAFMRLASEEQVALRLYREQGRSAREVAAKLGRTEDGVTSLVQRAVRKMREYLLDYYPERFGACGGKQGRRQGGNA